MATNPRFPDQLQDPNRRGPRLVQKAAEEPPRSATPGVVLAIVTAVLLLGAILYFMPRAPKAAPTPSNAVTPAQPAGGQLAISDLRMSATAVGAGISLEGQLTNSGSTPVNGVMAELVFPLQNGQSASVQAPILGIATTKSTNAGKVNGDTEDLTKSPVQPGQTRAVRIDAQAPAGWNHQVPAVRVVATTGTTQ